MCVCVSEVGWWTQQSTRRMTSKNVSESNIAAFVVTCTLKTAQQSTASSPKVARIVADIMRSPRLIRFGLLSVFDVRCTPASCIIPPNWTRQERLSMCMRYRKSWVITWRVIREPPAIHHDVITTLRDVWVYRAYLLTVVHSMRFKVFSLPHPIIVDRY